MARRTGLPAHIRAELPLRANAGIGLDPDYPTRLGTTVCEASVACRHKPSRDMLLFVQRIVDYLNTNGALHVTVVQDYRNRGERGALLIRWGGDVCASAVAETFAVSRTPCDTPRLPAWLSLRKDNDFDLRWQPPY